MEIVISNLESSLTTKMSELLNKTTMLSNDISSLFAVKYASIGAEEEQKKMEQKLKELEEWKKQVIEAYEKHKEEYMTECEEIKKMYADLLEKCNSNKPEGEHEKPSVPESPEKVVINVSGIWDTNWGEMTLNQTGKSVSGSYTYDKGKITGVLNGNSMTGTWSETPTYSPPRDAGKLEFLFGENSFSGSWGYGDGPLTGSWRGTRKVSVQSW